MNRLVTMEFFIKWMKEEGKSSHTIKSYLKAVSYFETWYFDNIQKEIDYARLNPMDLKEWRHYLIHHARKKNGQPLATQTINSYIEAIRTFLHFLYVQGIVRFDPKKYLIPQTNKKVYAPRWLDTQEKRILLRYIEDPELAQKNAWRYTRNKAIIYTMLYAGLRISEVTSLTVFDIQNGYINVREGKGEAARDVPINKTLSQALNEWMKEREKKNPTTDALFTSQKGGKLTPSGIYPIFENIVKNTNIPDLTPHTLRHTFAHDLVQNGVPLPYVATLLGHDDLDTTRVYTSPKKQGLKDAVDTLSQE